MAFYLDQQGNLPPASGTTGWEDGDGMSTRIALDLARAINNLGARTALRVTGGAAVHPGVPSTPQGGNLPGAVCKLLPNSSAEIYMFQTPIVLPQPGPEKLLWTLGVEGWGADIEPFGHATAIVTAATVYISPIPYTGPDAPTAFDPTFLGPGTLPSPVDRAALTISANGLSTRTYQLADRASAGGIYPALPTSAGLKGKDHLCYAIVTVTGYSGGDGPGATAQAYDLTIWPYEAGDAATDG